MRSTSPNYTAESEGPRYDALVVGMGPVGLATAYELAKKGNKVLLVEKRSEQEAAIRPMVVVLSPQSKKLLLTMITAKSQLSDDDVEFLDQLSSSSELKLSSIQKFTLNRIKELNESEAVVDIKYQTSLQSISLQEGKAEIENSGKIIEFNHLIAADGAHSKTLDLVNDSLDENEKIKKYTPRDMKHLEKTYHLFAYVKLSRTDPRLELELPKREYVSSFLKNKLRKRTTNQLYFLRFDKKSHNKSNKKSVKVAFVGETPKEIYDINQVYNETIGSLSVLKDILDKDSSSEILKDLSKKQTHSERKQQQFADVLEKLEKLENSLKAIPENREKVQQVQRMIDEVKILISDMNKNEKPEEIKKSIEKMKSDMIKNRNEFTLSYVKRAAAQYLGIKENELSIELTTSKKTPKKNILKLLTFRGGGEKAVKAAVQKNNHGAYLIGDSYFQPNYETGRGLNSGFDVVPLLGNLPRTKDGSSHELSEHMAHFNNQSKKNALITRSMTQAIRLVRKLGKIKKILPKTLELLVEKAEKRDRIDIRTNLEDRNEALIRFIDQKFNVKEVKVILNELENLDKTQNQRKQLIEKWEKMLKQWDEFLSKNTSIAKQYQQEILIKIKEINDLVQASTNKEIDKKQFNQFYEKNFGVKVVYQQDRIKPSPVFQHTAPSRKIFIGNEKMHKTGHDFRNKSGVQIGMQRSSSESRVDTDMKQRPQNDPKLRSSTTAIEVVLSGSEANAKQNMLKEQAKTITQTQDVSRQIEVKISENRKPQDQESISKISIGKKV